MDPTRINWSRRMAALLSDSDIPTDVTFKFKGTNDSEVSAHRMILAVVSPMFRKMFYVHNTVDMFAQEIIIEDTNAPAFMILIDAIYSIKTIQESLNGKTVDEIFAVLYLVTKYDIPELVQAVKDTLTSIPLTADTVLEVAGDVMDYSSTFKEEAQKLLLACAKFLKNKLTHPLDVFELIAENGDKMEVVHKLAVLVRENYSVPVNKWDVGSVPGLVESSGEDTDDEELNGMGNIWPLAGLMEWDIWSAVSSSEDTDDEEEDGDSEDSSNYLTGEDSDEESQEMESDSDDDAVEPLPFQEPSPPLPPQNDEDDLEAALQLLFL